MEIELSKPHKETPEKLISRRVRTNESIKPHFLYYEF